MKTIPVRNAQQVRAFLELPLHLYGDDPNWIRPLNKDIEEVFDPKKNRFFQKPQADCERWLLLDAQQKPIGRVAAFIDPDTVHKDNKQPTGGMGFFECINDQMAANALFQTCQDWLTERGMQAMDGPINFGHRDRWWGLLVEGFTPPNYCMPYNPPYYRELFENYGFQMYFKQLTYKREVQARLHPRLQKVGDALLQNPEYNFRHLEKNKLSQYAEDFRTIYNGAWSSHSGVGKMSEKQAQALLQRMKPILDPEIMWFAYHKGVPVGFYLMIPELNQAVKHLNGKFGILQKLQLLWMRRTGKIKKMFGVIFGVVPEYQGRGVHLGLVEGYRRVCQSNPNYRYTEFEMNWIGDFNPKMIRTVEWIGGEVAKVHHTYRKLFDPEQPFERMPIID
ncbi:MAG: hypothetical protein ACFCUI_04295 [Bernardetiaceae bacterium]